MAPKTAGIRHVHLLVADHGRSVAFYTEAFGMETTFADGDIVFLSSPGNRDSLALHLATTDAERAKVGDNGGYAHFGITILDRGALSEAIEGVEAAGGSLVERGEHAPGVPYAYVRDPDGYVIEI